jgi:beta-lactam-binding protein with PASTA domain
MRIIVMLALAGCVMNKGGTTTPTGGGGGGGGDPSVSAPPPSGPAAAPDANGELVVPNLIGKSLDEAQGLSKQAGFRNEVEATHPVDCGEGAPKDDGKINCQDPAAGSHVKAYTMIQVNVYKRPDHNHLTREDIEGLRGMTVAAAKVKLKQLGHTGSVRIEEPTQFIKNCKLDTVCDSQPESGTGFGDDVTFVVNKGKLEISAPPP